MNTFVSDLARQKWPESTALVETWENDVALPDL